MPAGSQTYTVDYSWGPPTTREFPAPLRDADGTVNLTISATELTPGTVELTWNVLIENYEMISNTPAEMQLRPRTDPYKTVRDDGLGVLRDTKGVSFGTVDYAAGSLNFTPDTTISIPVPRYRVTVLGFGLDGKVVYRNLFTDFDYIPAAAVFPNDESGHATVKYRSASSNTTVSESLTPGAFKFDITNQYSEDIVPGSTALSVVRVNIYGRPISVRHNATFKNNSSTFRHRCPPSKPPSAFCAVTRPPVPN